MVGRGAGQVDGETDLITNSIGVDTIKGDDRTIVFMYVLPPSETCRQEPGEKASAMGGWGVGEERRGSARYDRTSPALACLVVHGSCA